MPINWNKKNLIRKMYFLNAGPRVGQFLLFLKKNGNTYSVLALPECEAIFITDAEWANIDKSTVEYVDKVPAKVAEHSFKEWLLRRKEINIKLTAPNLQNIQHLDK